MSDQREAPTDAKLAPPASQRAAFSRRYENGDPNSIFSELERALTIEVIA